MDEVHRRYHDPMGYLNRLIDHYVLLEGVHEIYKAKQQDELRELYLAQVNTMLKTKNGFMSFEAYKAKALPAAPSKAAHQTLNREEIQRQVEQAQHVFDHFKPKQERQVSQHAGNPI